MKIAILFDITEKQHTSSWSMTWVKYCEENNLSYEIVNPYQRGVVDKLLNFDIILWHYSNYSFKDMLIAKNILYTLEFHGKRTFPSFKETWHFDDKLAETYLLESINAPIPKSYYYYNWEELELDIKNKTISFPIIAKLRNGSGSHNVKMLNNKEELTLYAKQMFSSGIDSTPNLFFKASSNIKSTKNLKTLITRAKRIPEFLKSRSNAKKFNSERGYVYLQEFIPNDGFDLKIVVVGDKLSFVGRNIREGEFRASGGGDLFYDKNRITKTLIDSAFTTSDNLKCLCMGYDYIINSDTQKEVIVEISYGFSHHAVLEAKGYFDRNGNWHDNAMNVPYEILETLVNEKK